MSSLIFELRTFNPNKRITFFKHKTYTEYLANSKYAIKNDKTEHGLFGVIDKLPNIEEMQSIEPIIEYVTKLANNKVPIYRGLLSLREYDAMRLGYDNQEKWKELLENKLVDISKTLNIKWEDLQYAGAVHIEKGHPHFQFFVWSKSRDKSNYFVPYQRINKLREKFTNEVFKEDLIPIYMQKDEAKKNVIAQNYILQQLKDAGKDEEFIKKIQKYENQFSNKKIMKKIYSDKELDNVIKELLILKEKLKETNGSIKYQYLIKYPEVIKQVNNISNMIIGSSIECKKQIEEYIIAKQKILEFKYTDKSKLKYYQEQERIKTEEEIIKLVGNKILEFERVLINSDFTYTEQKNHTRYMIFDLYNFLMTISYQENSRVELANHKYKKYLSKQAKKELSINKRNESEFDWES